MPKDIYIEKEAENSSNHKLTSTQIVEEIEKGYQDMLDGDVMDINVAFDSLKKEYDI